MTASVILISDDERSVSRKISADLVGMGYRIAAAVASAQEAAKVAKENPPDLAIVDLASKDESDLLDVADTIYSFLEIPVICLIDGTQDFVPRVIEGKQAIRLLRKPVKPGELYNSIENALLIQRMEKQLRWSETRFLNLIKESRDAVCVTGADGEVLDVNGPFSKFLGYSEREIVSNNVGSIFLDPSDGISLLNRLEQADEIEDLVVKLRGSNQQEIRCLANATVWRNPEGRIEFCIVKLTEAKSRRAASKELRAIQHSYRTFIEALNDGFVILNDKSVITYANNKMSRLLKYSREELIGSRITDFLDWDGVKAIKQELSRQRTTGEAGVREIQFVSKDGRVVPMSMSTRPVMDRDGNFKGSFGVATDISQRKQAEKALMESEERYRLLTHNSLTGIWIHDDHVFVFVNDRSAEMLGYRNEELIGRSTWDVIHPEDRELVRKRKEDRDLGKTVPSHYEIRLVRKDGEMRWMEIFSTVITFRGKAARMGNVVDITERKMARKAREESEERYRRLFELSPDGIIVEVDGKVVMANAASANILGASGPKALVGIRFTDLVQPKYRPQAERRYRTIVEEGRNADLIEQKFIRLDEKTIDVEVAGSPFLHLGKRGVQTVFRDVTERKRAKEDLHRELVVISALAELYVPLLARSGSMKDIADAVLEKAMSLTGSEHGYVSEIDPDTGDNLGHARSQMMGRKCEVSARSLISFPKGRDGEYHKLWGHSLNTVEPFFTNRAVTHPAARGLPEGHVPVRAFLSVPVLLGDVLVGQIALANPKQDYSERDLEDVKKFAAHYALGIRRQREEKSLLESKEKYRTIIENIEEGYYEVDLAGNMTFFNESMCRILGYTPQELMGMNNRQYMDEATSAEVFKHFNRLFKTGKTGAKMFEWELIRKDGSICNIEASVSMLKDSRGRPRGFRGICRDMTDRRRAEQELIKMEKLGSIGALAGGIAHDFNNLLTAILGNISFVRSGLREDSAHLS
ncbi:PAS domain S-box protein, partial [Thermodesulfobacteriota bacterium]